MEIRNILNSEKKEREVFLKSLFYTLLYVIKQPYCLLSRVDGLRLILLLASFSGMVQIGPPDEEDHRGAWGYHLFPVNLTNYPQN